MAFVINVKGEPLEIKFNYRTMYKANSELGSVDEKGNKNKDGASSLFSRVMDEDDTAIRDLINLVHKGKKLTEDEIFDSIEGYIEEQDGNEEEAYKSLFTNMKEEMLDSGFFVSKLNKQIENMEKGTKLLKSKKDEESQNQAQILGDMIDSMKKEISSHNAPATA